jgi:hypothetical protein
MRNIIGTVARWRRLGLGRRPCPLRHNITAGWEALDMPEARSKWGMLDPQSAWDIPALF